MSTLAEPAVYTPEDLLRLPDGDLYELADGKLVERNMSAKSSHVAGNLYGLAYTHMMKRPTGWLFPEGTSYQCFPDDPDKVRKPDFAFIRLGRFPHEKLPVGHIRIAPDLAAEVLSPNDIVILVEEKLWEYLRAGVRLVWIIDPDHRTVRVHGADGGYAFLHEKDELDGGDVIPGFRCKVADLFVEPVAMQEGNGSTATANHP